MVVFPHILKRLPNLFPLILIEKQGKGTIYMRAPCAQDKWAETVCFQYQVSFPIEFIQRHIFPSAFLKIWWNIKGLLAPPLFSMWVIGKTAIGKTSRRPPMNNLDLKRGVGVGKVSWRSFDLFNSMIYDLKRYVGLRWLFDPVLHSSLDDIVSRSGALATQLALSLFDFLPFWSSSRESCKDLNHSMTKTVRSWRLC